MNDVIKIWLLVTINKLTFNDGKWKFEINVVIILEIERLRWLYVWRLKKKRIFAY